MTPMTLGAAHVFTRGKAGGPFLTINGAPPPQGFFFAPHNNTRALAVYTYSSSSGCWCLLACAAHVRADEWDLSSAAGKEETAERERERVESPEGKKKPAHRAQSALCSALCAAEPWESAQKRSLDNFSAGLMLTQRPVISRSFSPSRSLFFFFTRGALI